MGDAVEFDVRDVMVHSAITWALFCVLVCVGGLVYAFSDPNIVTFGSTTALVIAATSGSLVAVVCWAPAAWALGRILRTVRSGTLHILAFALFGGAVGFILDRIGSFIVDFLIPSVEADPAWSLTRGAIVAAASAVCCATGRYVAWRARRTVIA